MNLRISNQLTMVGSCLTIAQQPDSKAVWDGKSPAAFATDLAQLVTDYNDVSGKVVLAENAGGGAADAKATAESAVENNAHVLARALARFFKKTGDRESRAKVDVSKSAIVLLRNQELIAKATEIATLGTGALNTPGAADYGVAAPRVAALTAAIGVFTKVMNSPRGQIVNRSTLLKEVETDTADLLAQLDDLDDLMLQFDTTDAGKRFTEAWRRARMIIDAGGGHTTDNTATTTPPPTNPSK